jgi:hypothetical protein
MPKIPKFSTPPVYSGDEQVDRYSKAENYKELSFKHDGESFMLKRVGESPVWEVSTKSFSERIDKLDMNVRVKALVLKAMNAYRSHKYPSQYPSAKI